MKSFNSYISYVIFLAFLLFLNTSILFAQKDSTVHLQEQLIEVMLKMDSIQNNSDDSQESAALFQLNLDSVQAILSNKNANKIDFKIITDSCDRFSFQRVLNGKIYVFSWNAYSEYLYETSAFHFILMKDSSQHSIQKVSSGFLVKDIFVVSDSCLLIQTSSQSHRNCNYTSFLITPTDDTNSFLTKEADISFSFSYGGDDEFIEYDAVSKSVRYANRPCYYWSEVEDGETYPVATGEFKIDDKACRLKQEN